MGRTLDWGPSSATTMLGAERAKSVLSGHPRPHCPWESEKAGPWGDDELGSNVPGMCAQGVMCSRITPGPGGASLSPPPGAPPLQGSCPLTPGLQPVAQDSRQGARRRRWGAVATSTSAALGTGHVLIPAGRGSALQHSAALALTQAPATPGSCTCSRTGPRKRAAVGTDSCPPPPHTLAT